MSLDEYTIRAGTTARSILVFVRDPSGRGVAGLGPDTPGAWAAYAREGEPGAHRVELVPAEPGRWRAGAFGEVDAELLPGLYQFGCPDAMLAPGSTRAVLLLRFPGASPEPVDVALVAYDPQDPVRLGMSALSPQGRIDALRGAFPRLTRSELMETDARKDPD